MNDLTSAVVHFCMLQYISFILKTMAKPIETLTYLPSWLQLPFTAVSKLAKYVAVSDSIFPLQNVKIRDIYGIKSFRSMKTDIFIYFLT